MKISNGVSPLIWQWGWLCYSDLILERQAMRIKFRGGDAQFLQTSVSQMEAAAITATIETFKLVHRDVKEAFRDDPVNWLEPIWIGTRRKKAIAADLYAELRTQIELRRRLREFNLSTYGEESLRNPALDLTGGKGLSVLLDVIDGTDLHERNLSNWASAAVYYYAPLRKIVGAFVAIPELQACYYATDRMEGAVKYLFHSGSTEPVSGVSRTTTISDSTLMFYGQKLDHFLSVARNEHAIATLLSLQQSCRSNALPFDLRIQTLGGIPAMMRMIDGPHPIDAVMELQGQFAHDVVAGLYIAQKAGATLCDLNGEPIALSQAMVKPAAPSTKLRYILAGTSALASELRTCFGEAKIKTVPDHTPAESPIPIM